MNRTHLTRSIVLAIQMLGVSMSVSGQSPQSDAKPSGKSMKTYDLEKLVSSNEQPEIASVMFRPFFAERFDFNEQSRVAEVVNSLCKNWNGELWFDLVSRSDDDSYCMTTHRPSGPGAKNWTVGEVCDELAYLQLTRIFNEISLTLATDDFAKGRKPYVFQLLEGKSLKDWVKSHSFNRFEDALAHAVTIALNQIASDEKISFERKQYASRVLKEKQEEVARLQNGIGRVCFVWEKYTLVTKRSAR